MRFNYSLKPPQMAKKDFKTEIHGRTLIDPYHWFRNKEAPEVLEHLNLENQYTEAQLTPYKPQYDKVMYEMKSRILEDDQSFPILDRDFYYYSRDLQGKEHKVYCRASKLEPTKEQVILDLNELSVGKEFLLLGDIQISPDQNILAYSIDENGSEDYCIFFKKFSDNETLSFKIEKSAAHMVWGSDNQTLFYLELDENHRPNKVYKYNLKDQSRELVYSETSSEFHVSIQKSKSERYLFINSYTHGTSEVSYIDLHKNSSLVHLTFQRSTGIQYELEDSGRNSFFIYTNKEATNFKILEIPIQNLNYKNAIEVVPHKNDLHISDLEVFENCIVLTERYNGLKQLRVFNYNNQESHIIPVPEENCNVDGYENPNFFAKEFLFSYSSLITPPSILSYHFESKKVDIKKTKFIPGYNKELYKTERRFYKSHDGTMVPISIIHKKDLILDGKNPCYLYGYGSYGLNISPTFKTQIFSLIDRGFVYAIAHIRGSSTMGRQWYEDGKLLNKKNTFLDFIASAEFLISEKYTSNGEIVISGGSAGGMLVGTAVNMRPELFKAVVAHVPFVDCVNTMLDDTLPLTTIEYEEWGNPNDKNYFEYILSYSPYDNIKSQPYPHVFVTAGLNDPRVTYWEPAKWVAKLREFKTDHNIILLKTNMEAGHWGKTGRYESLKELAEEFTFILIIFGKCEEMF